jgi:dihydrodipicolinate synthase/N-acetylneuraminate lyase
LKKLGIISNATPRPPLMPVLPEIAASVERVIESSGLAAEVVKVAA